MVIKMKRTSDGLPNDGEWCIVVLKYIGGAAIMARNNGLWNHVMNDTWTFEHGERVDFNDNEISGWARLPPRTMPLF